MPLVEWRTDPPMDPLSSPEICNTLRDLRAATGRQWYVEEAIVKYRGLVLRRPVYEYDLLLLIDETGEYQVINGVTTESEVLAYCYGAIGQALSEQVRPERAQG